MLKIIRRNENAATKEVLLTQYQVEALEKMAYSLTSNQTTMTVGEISEFLEYLVTPGAGREEFQALMQFFNLQTGSPANMQDIVDRSILSQTSMGCRDMIVHVPIQRGEQ